MEGLGSPQACEDDGQAVEHEQGGLGKTKAAIHSQAAHVVKGHLGDVCSTNHILNSLVV